MAYTEDLYIFKDTQTLCEKLLEYSRNVSKLIRYSEYSVMISKACQAMDLVRQINSSFEGRDEGITRYILLIAEVKSRINLFARSQFLPLKNATNLDFLCDKVTKEAYGWQKAERKRKGESHGAKCNMGVPSRNVTRDADTQPPAGR